MQPLLQKLVNVMTWNLWSPQLLTWLISCLSLAVHWAFKNIINGQDWQPKLLLLPSFPPLPRFRSQLFFSRSSFSLLLMIPSQRLFLHSVSIFAQGHCQGRFLIWKWIGGKYWTILLAKKLIKAIAEKNVLCGIFKQNFKNKRGYYSVDGNKVFTTTQTCSRGQDCCFSLISQLDLSVVWINRLCFYGNLSITSITISIYCVATS